VLARAQAFVTHGGMNSLMESLYFGVPMVVVPQMVEQRVNAHRVAELGLGVTLPPEALTVDALREAVERVDQSDVRERVKNMRRIVREAGGAKRAVDAILEFSRVRVA
jgi:MGT family glycosyltransferase